MERKKHTLLSIHIASRLPIQITKRHKNLSGVSLKKNTISNLIPLILKCSFNVLKNRFYFRLNKKKISQQCNLFLNLKESESNQIAILSIFFINLSSPFFLNLIPLYQIEFEKFYRISVPKGIKCNLFQLYKTNVKLCN